MSATERLIYFFEMQVKTNKVKASPPPLSDVIEKIIEAYDAGEALFSVNKGKAIVEILKIRRDLPSNIVTFFLRCSDRDGADVYFANPDIGTSRVERKRDGEGRAFGAHFSISLQPVSVGGTVYSALLEKSTGLSSSIVKRLFQAILRNQYQKNENLFTCDDISGARTRDGKAKQIGFRPMLELNGLPSDQFIADLEQGTLKEIQLIQYREERQVGARPWLVEDQVTTRLTAKATRHIANVWGELQSLFSEKSGTGIGCARVKFKRADGQADSVDINPETGGILDDKYVKAKRISDIRPPMDECADDIVSHFAKILEDELIAMR